MRHGIELATRAAGIGLALLLTLQASQALALDPSCPSNSHPGGKACECNTGYAKAKDGKCQLKRADFGDATAKPVKPAKTEKTDKPQ